MSTPRYREERLKRDTRRSILEGILIERENGIEKFGTQYARDGGYWLAIVTEELGEASQALLDLWDAQGRDDIDPYAEKLMMELFQTAATCMGFIERVVANYSVESLHRVLARIAENCGKDVRYTHETDGAYGE